MECAQRLNGNTQSLDNEKLALAISLDSRIAETKRLVTEIQEQCNLEEFEDESMRSSFVAFKTGMEAKATSVTCMCPECKQEQASSELGIVAKRLAVTQDWLSALREYRSTNDLEVVRRPSGQSTKYFSGGKYFQRVGTYRGHGASAIKPKLQMQNSYDVAALTENDMVNRPLKRAPGEEQAALPKQPMVPGLEGRYTHQADGSILVHDGIYTSKSGISLTLKESHIVLAGSIISINGGSKIYVGTLFDYEDEDDYSSDDFTSSDEDDYDDDDGEDEVEEMGWEVEFQHLMDNLVL